MSGELLQARALPSGAYEITDNRDATDRLRNGDATLGWSGMDGLSLVINVVEQRWEVRVATADGGADLLMHRPYRHGEGVPIVSLIRELVAHDTHHIDVVARLDAADLAREKARADAFHEQTGPAADKLAWALGRDLDLPAQDGRVFPLGNRT